jgi:exosortase A
LSEAAAVQISAVAPAEAERFARWRAIALMGLVLATFAAFWPTLLSLRERWEDTVGRTYTHGYVVVLLMFWMIWRDRARLAAVPGKPWLPALLLAAAGAIGWLVAYRAGLQIVHQAALPLLAAVAVLTAFGWAVLRALTFPLAWLYLAIPIWDAILPLLNSISVFAVRFLLRVADVPAYFVNNRFEIPGGTFEIADGCSGVHFFVVALTVSLLYGELNRDSTRTRLKLVVFALLLAMATNWIRIFIIVLAGYLTDMTHSLVVNEHYSFGWYMFAGMMVMYFLIVRRWPAPELRPTSSIDAGGVAIPRRGVAAAMAGLALAPLTFLADSNRATAAQLERTMRADGGVAQPAPTPGWTPVFPNADATFTGAFGEVELHIAGFASQGQGKELAGFSTSVLGETLHRVRLPRGDVPTPWNESAAFDENGRRWLLWSAYRMEDRWYRNPLGLQIEYGFRSLAGAPATAVVALRARCESDDCAGARRALLQVIETHYP